MLAESCPRLMARAIEELDRGSVIGVLDHALDLLAIIAETGDGRGEWFRAVVALLSTMPAEPPFDGEWGHSAAAEFRDRLNRALPSLVQTLSEVLQEPRLDEVLSQRFFYKEFLPFAADLGKALCQVATTQSPHVLEDVASAIGAGAVIGDPNVALSVLTHLAQAAGIEGDIPALYGDARRSKRNTGNTTKPPDLADWIWDALQQIIESSDRRTTTRQPTSAFRLQVIPSLSWKGGMSYTTGALHLEMVLYVNLLHGPALGPVELSIPQQRNPWLAAEYVCYLGRLEPESPVVVPIHAELAKALDPNAKLQLQYQLLYKELGSGETKTHDDRHQPAISEPRAVEIKGYPSANGFPLRLTGDDLKLSSASVRTTLKKISAGLRTGPLAAMIVGRRRRGKTSILETIWKDPEIGAKYRIVFDKFDSMPAATVGEAMNRLGMNLDKLTRKLGLTIEPIQDRIGVQPNTASAIVQEWLEAVTDALPGPSFGLILIDEFQKWLSRLHSEGRAQVFLLLRALVNRPHSEKFGVSVILSGLSDLKEYRKASADFKNFFPIYEIECFTAAETAALLRSNSTVDYDVRAVRLIHELSGGNPYLVNLLGNEITAHLSDLGRSYCLALDVENVVKGELADANSRVWSFVEYLFRQGEEDQSAMIEELPAVEALAWALRQRGTRRTAMRLPELQTYLARASVACNEVELERLLNRAADNELLIRSDRGYAFASQWVGEWLAASATDRPRGITTAKDPALVLNQYRKIEKLSTQGAQAEVYRAEDIRYVNSQYLLKIYPRRHNTQAPAVAQREVAALRQVNDQGVVKCYFYGVDEEKGDVLVLEWVEGRSLRDLICHRDAMAEKLIGPEGKRDAQLTFIAQLAAALAACHRREIVHKDLKPENILVTPWAWPKIIDFGLASQPIQPSDNQGTLGPYTENYVAPERLRGDSRKSAADIFSLGVVAYELLTGVLPYRNVLAQDRRIVPLTERRPTIGVKIAELIQSMLADDPASRPTAAYIAAALPDAAVAQDWKECNDLAFKAACKDDYEAALTWWMRAVACTPQQERASSAFAQILRDTLEAAVTAGRTQEYLQQLVQPALQAICKGEHKPGDGSENPFDHLGQTLMDCVFSATSVSRASSDGQAEVLGYLVDLLSDSAPTSRLGPILSRLLDGMDRELIWCKRHTLFDIAVRHRLASTVADHIIYRWCLKSASRCRQMSTGSLVEAGVWLRRAERMGASNSAEFKQERAELLSLTSVSAGSLSPPPVAKQVSSDKCIGESERGHCNADRVRRWVDRLQRRFDFVEQVKRLEADPNIDPRPCRLLDPDKAAQHRTKVLQKDWPRIIPAVLDDTYHKGAIALRINIWLAEGCTVMQRDHAIDLLKADAEIFGDTAG
jgi:tRNA A-37 threonylcarbamoyl transferase component Bud32